MLENKCPDKDKLIAFFIDGTSTEKNDGLEVHLAGCATCRTMLSSEFSAFEVDAAQVPDSLLNQVKNLPETQDKIIGRSEIVDNEDATGWFSVRFLQIAFAASLMLFAGYFGMTYYLSAESPPAGDVLRDASPNKKAIRLLLPENDSFAEAEKISFSWSPIDGATTYTLILSDETGDIVKEIKTESSSFIGSVSKLGFEKGKKYFWQVRARFVDGTSLESEARKISIRD